MPPPRLCGVLQVRPDDTVVFKKLTIEQAYAQRLATDAMVAAVKSVALQVGWRAGA